MPKALAIGVILSCVAVVVMVMQLRTMQRQMQRLKNGAKLLETSFDSRVLAVVGSKAKPKVTFAEPPTASPEDAPKTADEPPTDEDKEIEKLLAVAAAARR